MANPKPENNSLRLLKVIVQPGLVVVSAADFSGLAGHLEEHVPTFSVQAIYVGDDGENLTEHPTEPVPVPASQWPEFAKRLEERLPEFKEQLATAKAEG